MRIIVKIQSGKNSEVDVEVAFFMDNPVFIYDCHCKIKIGNKLITLSFRSIGFLVLIKMTS